MPAMRKKPVLLFLLISLALYYAFYLHTVGPFPDAHFTTVVSTDRSWQAGEWQEMLVHCFSRANNSEELQTDIKIKAIIEITGTENKKKSALVTELTRKSDGAFGGGVNIPSDAAGIATITLLTDEYRPLKLASFNRRISDSSSLIVIPPVKEVFAGDWINFKIGVIDRKSGKGKFKTPVRVRLQSPGGQTTVNRVISTDIYGSAFFTTHINPWAPAGNYHFTFTSGVESVKINIRVASKDRKDELLGNEIKNSIRGLLPMPAFFEKFKPQAATDTTDWHSLEFATPEQPPLDITDLKLAGNQAILSYNCPESVYRRIELWQNGRVIYSSDLPLLTGRVSLPLHKNISSGIPVSFRLWQKRRDHAFVCHERSVITGDLTGSFSHHFLKEAAELFAKSGAEHLFHEFFDQTGSLIVNRSDLPVEYLPVLPTLHIISGKEQPAQERAVDFHEARLDKQAFRHKFFVINDNLNLSRFRVSAIRIFLDQRKFFSALLSSIRRGNNDINCLIAEAECRALRFPLLNMAEQSAELEKLEGLLIPLSSFLAEHPQDNSTPRILRALKRLSYYIFVPESFFDKAEQIDMSRIGPCPPFLQQELSLETLSEALKPGGKVNIISDERTVSLLLTGKTVTHRKQKTGSRESRPEQIVNARATPILIDLDFSDNGN